MQKGERTSIAQTPSEWSAAFTPPNMKQAERATVESGAELMDVETSFPFIGFQAFIGSSRWTGGGRGRTG